MPPRRRTRGPRTSRAALAALGAVVVVSVVVRLLPLAPFALWGSDSGEYLLLTQRLVETGRVQLAYDGWGIAYPFFPGMFVVDGAAELVLGLGAYDALRWPMPILAGVLLPLGTYLLARRLVGDVRVALLASAFVALTSVNALVTSHPMPGTLGHVLLLAAVVALAHAYDDRAWTPWAVLAALALVPSHHLSTWFLAGGVAAALLVREAGRARRDPQALRVEVPVLAAAVVPAGLWWLGVADPFRDRILSALGVPPLAVAFAGYALLLGGLPALVALRRWLAPGATMRVRYPSPHVKAALAGGLFLAVLGLLLVLYATRVPGGNIHPTRTTLAYALPQLAWLSFALVGTQTLHAFRRGPLVIGWIVAILASLAFAVATESRVLFPFRHPDYLFVAAAVPVGLGMVAAYDDLILASTPREAATVRRTAIVCVALLLVVSFLLSQPPRDAIGGFEEGTTRAELELVEWAAAELPDDAVVAADHRLSSLLFGLAGARPTWDSGAGIYHAENWTAAREELACADTLVDPCARVEYVALSRVVAEGVITVQWEDAVPMSDAALAKFADPARFEVLHEVRGDGDWAAMLRVRWEAAP